MYLRFLNIKGEIHNLILVFYYDNLNEKKMLESNETKESLKKIIDVYEIKWFYKEEEYSTKKTSKEQKIINDLKWTPFNKLDSFNLEKNYQNYQNDSLTNVIQVLDGLYEANLQTRKCKAIYWNGIIFRII